MRHAPHTSVYVITIDAMPALPTVSSKPRANARLSIHMASRRGTSKSDAPRISLTRSPRADTQEQHFPNDTGAVGLPQPVQ
jgi:hypothetical protein